MTNMLNNTSSEIQGERRTFTLFLYTLIGIPFITKVIVTKQLPRDPWVITEVSIVTFFVAALVFYIHRKHQRVIILSETDGLTGLYNRHKLNEDLRMEVNKAHRSENSLFMAYADVDRFKAVNDNWGHDVGDQLLKELGQFLTQSLRKDFDTCYRVGGDEFVMLLPLVAESKRRHIHDRIKKIEKSATTTLSKYGSSISIGLVELKSGESPEQFIKRADKEMYKKKQQNKRKTKTA